MFSVFDMLKLKFIQLKKIKINAPVANLWYSSIKNSL